MGPRPLWAGEVPALSPVPAFLRAGAPSAEGERCPAPAPLRSLRAAVPPAPLSGERGGGGRGAAPRTQFMRRHGWGRRGGGGWAGGSVPFPPSLVSPIGLDFPRGEGVEGQDPA